MSVSRALRGAWGFAQEDWAAQLDVSRKTVQRWERGEGAPDDRVERLLVSFCVAQDVFERVTSGALTLGVSSASELHDVLARARRPRAARPGAAPAQGRAERLIGRDDDLDALSRAISRHRLVTITGPGGVGKTSLATAVRPGCPVVVVPLAEVRDPAMVISEIARRLGAVGHQGRTARDAVCHMIGSAEWLLVVDNLEHLVGAVAVIEDLLASCAGLRVLVTSRVPLRLTNEHEYRLGPLDAGDTHSAAVELFVTRARHADPVLHFASGELELVVDICRRLGGLPLAVELAAARLRTVALVDVHARIDRPLGVLGRGPSDRPRHQQTLRDSLRWSYDLLNDPQQRLLLRVSCFVGGCTLDAIEIVGIDTAVEDIGALVEGGLVQRHSARYRVLETVREFAAGCAATQGTGDEDREVFCSWAVGFAEEQSARSRGPTQVEAITAFEVEHTNCSAALQWLVDTDRGPLAHRLATALVGYWDVRSMLADARRWIELTLGTSGAHARRRATLLNWLAYFCGLHDDLRSADRFAREALTIWEREDLPAGVGYARLILGRVAAERDELDEAMTELLDSERCLRGVGDLWGLIRPINAIGETARAQGCPGVAVERHREALELCRSLGERASQPSILCDIAHASLDLGELRDAEAAAHQALAIARQLGNIVGVANSLDTLARFHHLTGDHRTAVERWGEASAHHDAIGLPIERRDRAQYRQDVASALDLLGESVFADRWEIGRASAQ